MTRESTFPGQPSHISPSWPAAQLETPARKEQLVNSYQVRQLDSDGLVLSERQVDAHDCNSAIRQLQDVYLEAQRIEVYNEQGEKAGEIKADYWRQKRVHRR